MLTVQQRLVDLLSEQAAGKNVAEVRIGLGYTAVRLDTGEAGVAWTPHVTSSSCTQLQAAGTLGGSKAGKILALLVDESPLARAVGLATANALLASRPTEVVSREGIVASLQLDEKDHVVMVGFFAPLLGDLKKTGCRLDIIELNPAHGQGTLTSEEGETALADCSVAIVTGTSLINGTFSRINSALGKPRAAVLLGPSAPLMPEAFSATKITHVAGSRVTEPEALLKIVSEGGGTRLMKPYLDFQTLSWMPASKKEKAPCSGENCSVEKCHSCGITLTCGASKA